MKNQIKLAVAGAVFAAASSANAGIVIPAGDWTLDVNGNVNAFATFSQHDNEGTITGDLLAAAPRHALRAGSRAAADASVGTAAATARGPLGRDPAGDA